MSITPTPVLPSAGVPGLPPAAAGPGLGLGPGLGQGALADLLGALALGTGTAIAADAEAQTEAATDADADAHAEPRSDGPPEDTFLGALAAALGMTPAPQPVPVPMPAPVATAPALATAAPPLPVAPLTPGATDVPEALTPEPPAPAPTPAPALTPTPVAAADATLALTPTLAPAPASASAPAPAAPDVGLSVVRQVFPEVTRIVTSTPTDRAGTQRITLTLQPEQLGEVRVTLVVRDGAVHVRLVGESDNPAVHRALATGAPELQRLLERTGAGEARVQVQGQAQQAHVRDTFGLPATATTTAASTPDGTALGADPGGSHPGRQSQQDRQSAPDPQTPQSQQGPPSQQTPPRHTGGAPVPTSTPPASAGHLDRIL